MSIPEFNFGRLEDEMQLDQIHDQMNTARSAVRLASQIAVAIEADAIEAGLPKDVARALSIAYLEGVTGLELVSVKR